MKVFACFLLVKLVLVAPLALGQDKPPADAKPTLKIGIAVPERGVVVVTDDESHFHVVIQNVSDKPQKIIDEWNSWGYFNLCFEFTTPAGEKKVMEKLGRDWSKNFLTTTTLQPGEVLVRDVFLSDTIWSNLPVMGKDDAKVRLRAIFEQKLEQADEKVDMWQGRITSADQEITFRNFRQK